jgi:hypothetical protein
MQRRPSPNGNAEAARDALVGLEEDRRGRGRQARGVQHERVARDEAWPAPSRRAPWPKEFHAARLGLRCDDRARADLGAAEAEGLEVRLRVQAQREAGEGCADGDREERGARARERPWRGSARERDRDAPRRSPRPAGDCARGANRARPEPERRGL